MNVFKLKPRDQFEHEAPLQQSVQNMNRAVDPSCHVKGLKRNTYKTATLTSAYMTRVSVACPAVGGFMWSSTIMKGTVKYLRNHTICQPLLTMITSCSCQRQGDSADMMQVKLSQAALDGQARSE